MLFPLSYPPFRQHHWEMGEAMKGVHLGKATAHRILEGMKRRPRHLPVTRLSAGPQPHEALDDSERMKRRAEKQLKNTAWVLGRIARQVR